MTFPSPLVLATSNPGKRREWAELLEPRGVQLLERELESPEETASSYAGNAVIKARAAAKALGQVALGDDGGLEVAALQRGPGLWTRRWAMQQGGWEAARAYLAEHALGSEAWLFCGVAVVWPQASRVVTVTGSVRGHIAIPNSGGPSLEPCFVPEGCDAPMPELPRETWKRVHQRVRALELLLAKLTPAP